MFAWPLIFLEESLAFQLQLLMAEISAWFLNFIGVATDRVGTALVSAADPAAGLAQGASFHLGVDGPCSGMRSLFALLMVAALYGYLTLDKNWKRLTLFALAFPLALFGNFVRIMILLFGVKTLGADVAIGASEGEPSLYHTAAGLAVFVCALGGMVMFRKMLGQSPKAAARDRYSVRQPASVHSLHHRSLIGATSFAVALCAVGLIACLTSPPPAAGGSSGVVLEFPRSVGDFIGVRGERANSNSEPGRLGETAIRPRVFSEPKPSRATFKTNALSTPPEIATATLSNGVMRPRSSSSFVSNTVEITSY